LYDEDGQRVEDIAKVKEMAVDFYKKLLGTKSTHFSIACVDRVKQLISPIVPAEKASMLDRDVTAEEIKNTIFSM
jgi:hypothetical protein